MNPPKAKTISREKMLEAGYKEYEVGKFQKCVRDEKGKKYFINCDLHVFPIGNWWEFYIQIDVKQGNIRIETVQWFNNDGEHSGNTIEGVEDFFEYEWDMHGEPYYERFD